MLIYTSYKARIKHFSHIFEPTVALYRAAVDFFISVLIEHPEVLADNKGQTERVNAVERLTVKTKGRTEVPHDFSEGFYKFPAYLRRAAIAEALGKVSSWRSNVDGWKAQPADRRGKKPGSPKAGDVFPVLYKGNMTESVNRYLMNIKVFRNNTWDWLTVKLRKSDVDYILRRCGNRKMCSPTLRKRGKKWYLDFPFEESVQLCDTPLNERLAVCADLGINSPCTCSVMRPDGTVAGRHFLSLPAEYDSLGHALNRIKREQQKGNFHLPSCWARVKGISHDISVKTAQFIIDVAAKYNADVIVFEHLDLSGKKKGSKKQLLHMWRAQEVQRIVADKAHRMRMHVSHVCAWGTSRLAFDGSSRVKRGRESGRTNGNYSLCEFASGKLYNCDLNASYNIGARYFIREHLKSLPEKARLSLEAKVPQAGKRSTCTLDTLISLYAELEGWPLRCLSPDRTAAQGQPVPLKGTPVP